VSKKKKYYVVWVGQTPGIYDNWTDCLVQTKGFPNAKYKSFKTLKEAESAFKDSHESHYQKSERKAKTKIKPILLEEVVERNSIAVDAACSGNPGVMEYRGVDTFTKDEIFRKGPYPGGTNNLGEFLALVHGLAYLKNNGKSDTVIYTDSRTALSWVNNKRVKTTLKPNDKNQVLFTHVARALEWVQNNVIQNRIIKWDTKNWGEIPADFGRK